MLSWEAPLSLGGLFGSLVVAFFLIGIPYGLFLAWRRVIRSAKNGAVEMVSVSLRNGGQELVGLNVTLILPSGNHTTTFADISKTNPALTGSLVTQDIALPLGTMETWTVYSMVENCSFADGTTSRWTVIVELEG